METAFSKWVDDAMMIELTYLTALPLPVTLAIVISVLVIVGLVLQSCVDVITSDPHPPELYYKQSSVNDYVIMKCKLKTRSLRPSLLLRSSHLQTILPYLLPRPDVTFDREYLQMKDKGVVALDWVRTEHVKLRRKAPVLVVIPSWTEGAVSTSSVCHQAVSKGFKPVVFNRRGHGGSYLTTPKLTSSGDPSDLRQVITYLWQRMPKSPLAGVAFGSGCGLLLSYLGEFGSSALLSVAVCVSPSYDEPARFSCRQGKSPYDFLLLLRQKAAICKHLPALASVMDVNSLISAWTFDHLVQTVFTSPQTTNTTTTNATATTNATTSTTTSSSMTTTTTSVEQYWESNNPMRDVDDISIPILCVNSSDDPINPKADIPFQLFECYPNFLLALTDRGGHCGFLEGLPARSWSDSLALDYIESVIDFTVTKTPSSSHTNLNGLYDSASSTSNNSSLLAPCEYHRSRSGSQSHHPLSNLQQSSAGGRLRVYTEGSNKARPPPFWGYHRVNGVPMITRHNSFTSRQKRQRSTL